MLRSRLSLAIIALIASLGMASAQFDRTYTWTGTVNTWTGATGWTVDVGLANPFPDSNTSRALFNNNVNTTVNVNDNFTLHTLEFGNSAGSFTLNNNTLTMATNGAVTFGSAGSQTVNTNITLSGALAVNHNLSGTNTINGTISGVGQTLTHTSVAGSNFIYGGNVSLGSLVKSGNGTLTFSGSMVAFATALTLNAGTTNINTTSTSTIAGNITGAGNLAQNGSGTTILTGTNSYGGITTISAGTLQVGSGGTVGSIGAGAITNNSALSFSRSDATSIANNISGSGNLTKSGAGTMTYTGAGTYTGTTTISGGSLVVNGTLDNTGATVTALSGTSLGGTGTINRAVIINSGSIIRGGDVGTIGTLNVTGTTTVLGAATNGGQITTRTSGATSGGSGTVADPFILSSNSLLALGGTGVLNLDPTAGKFRFLIENDSTLAQFKSYSLVLATANNGNQFQRAGISLDAFTAADFDVFGQNSANPFTDLQLTRTGNNLILTFVTVPEPGLMLGMGAGVLALGAFLRKRFA